MWARFTSPRSRKVKLIQDDILTLWNKLQKILKTEEELINLNLFEVELNNLLNLLLIESKSSSLISSEEIGETLELILKDEILLEIVFLTKDNYKSRILLIEWFGKGIDLLDCNWLIHSGVHKALVALITNCVLSNLNSLEELNLVILLNKLTKKIQQFPQLLLIFFTEIIIESNPTPTPTTQTKTHTPSNSTSTTNSFKPKSSTFSSNNPRSSHDFLLFTYLLKFIHREGKIGKNSRQGLLSIIKLALQSTTSSNDSESIIKRDEISNESKSSLIKFLIDSDFAQVLGAGLGALYGILPSKLIIRNQFHPTSSPTTTDNNNFENGGMNLGGMGNLIDIEKLKLEELKLKSLGIGNNLDEGVLEGIEIWCQLIEFTQTVLSFTCSSTSSTEDGLDSLIQKLISSILTSIRTLFLQNVLYPSILECTDLDNSSIAVLSYLNSLLGVIKEGSILESCVIGFLMGEEVMDDFSLGGRGGKSISECSNTIRSNNKTSNNLIPLPTNFNYFNSFNRFTLTDLLLISFNSNSTDNKITALNLFNTMLSKHDRWSLGLLDIILDQGATAFPVTLRSEEEEEENLFEYKERELEEEVFIYKSSLTSITSTNSNSLKTPKSNNKIPSLGTPLPKTPSYQQHISSMNSLSSLISIIDPTYDDNNGGMNNYLFDAELLICNDLGFKRGIEFEFELETITNKGKRSGLFNNKLNPSAKELSTIKIGHRHQLNSTESKLIEILLNLFRNWFKNKVELNLILSQVFSKLSICPFRSLENWLLPKLTSSNQQENNRKVRNSLQGDDRSIDFDLINSPKLQSDFNPITTESNSLLFIINSLVNSIKDYKQTIQKFDSFLIERRNGLLFVDNLTEALDTSTFISSLLLKTSPSFLTTTPTRNKNKNNTVRGGGEIGTKSPFQNHYYQTEKMKINPIIIDSPKKNQNQDDDNFSDFGNNSPTKRLSTLPPTTSSTGFSTIEDDQEEEEKEEEVLPVSLSEILDNIIILEEFIKELSSIITVRKSFGIDSVQFI